MKLFFQMGVLGLVSLSSLAFAKSWSCSVNCEVTVNSLLGSKYIPGFDRKMELDFKAYCDDLGGSVRLGPGTCYGVNNDNYQCVRRVPLTDEGSSYKGDLFEARQAARQDCKENLLQQLGSNCTPYIHGDQSGVVDTEPPKCN